MKMSSQGRRSGLHATPSGRLGWLLLLVLGLWSVAAHAEPLRYRYVSLNQLLPPGFLLFDPVAISDSGRVYATVYDSDIAGHVAVYAGGRLTILQPGYATAANERGTVGGFVFDPTSGLPQAALFRGNRVELVPFRPGETESLVVALNDPGTALVESYDTSGSRTYSLYRKGRSFLLDIDPDISLEYINNRGILAGTFRPPSETDRGFRFDPATGETALLDPVAPDEDAWVQGINDRGDALGYSYVAGGRERVGVWGRDGLFRTYFVEGTPDFPTVSNRLRFNNRNLIVITDVSRPADEVGDSYLVPRPGVRLNLADLVENLPQQKKVSYIIDVNQRGSMIGLSFEGRGNVTDEFLLERVGSAAR